MDAQALDNGSGLVWRAADGAPKDTKYEVLWRETGAAEWQYTAPAEKYADASVAPGQETGDDVYRSKVPVSKDNVIFGIRACDAAGHCSPAVAPVPFPRKR